MDALSPDEYADLKKKMDRLHIDTVLILSRVSRGENNEAIVKWSKDWSFSPRRVEQALIEIYNVFGLKALADENEKRVQAGALYKRYYALRVVACSTKRKAG
jgi:hypothetical protein